MGCPHTSVNQGKKVEIKLVSGELIEDTFLQRKSQYIILKEYGRLNKEEIKYMKIRKCKQW